VSDKKAQIEFGGHIRRLRLSREKNSPGNFTAEAVAKPLWLTEHDIAAVENGLRSLDAFSAERLAKVLRLDNDEEDVYAALWMRAAGSGVSWLRTRIVPRQEDYGSFGDYIRWLRDKRYGAIGDEFSIGRFAEYLGVSIAHISDIEFERVPVSEEEANKAAQFFLLNKEEHAVYWSLYRTANKLNIDAPISEIVSEDTGRKDDSGKPDYSLIPPFAIDALARVLTFGAKKYSRDNWRKVPDAKNRYIAAALRHVFAYARGEKLDDESSEHHLAHAMCCLAFIVELDSDKR